jgi:hypothetical protein
MNISLPYFKVEVEKKSIIKVQPSFQGINSKNKRSIDIVDRNDSFLK